MAASHDVLQQVWAHARRRRAAQAQKSDEVVQRSWKYKVKYLGSPYITISALVGGETTVLMFSPIGHLFTDSSHLILHYRKQFVSRRKPLLSERICIWLPTAAM